MEDQLEKEARFRQLMVHSSHDSAIDTDSMEWETEVVELEKHRVRATEDLLKCLLNQHTSFVLSSRCFSHSGHGFEGTWV